MGRKKKRLDGADQCSKDLEMSNSWSCKIIRAKGKEEKEGEENIHEN